VFGLGQDFLFAIPGLLIALTIYAYAQARVAVWLGDPTPRYMGRLTLNPVTHLDPWGLVLMVLTHFGWTKPVPINSGNFRDREKGTLFVALAGPSANILAALIINVLLNLLVKFGVMNVYVYNIFILTIYICVGFAVFNLIPIPPMDGARILRSFLSPKQAELFERIAPYGPFIIMGLVVLNVTQIFVVPLQYRLLSIIDWLTRLVF
jgi:Zn-dependent protease